MAGRQGLLSFAVPALLVVVASLQLYRAATLDQSPWLGAGFGMFATVDGDRTRVIRCQADGESRPIPPAAAEAERRARVVPTQSNLDRLAGLVLAVEASSTDVVDCSLWRVSFDPEALTVSLIRQTTGSASR